jgi:hypothetical protein
VNNYATATIQELSGGGTFNQTGTTYTLNLGTLAQGTSQAPIDLGILNDVLGPADLQSGSFAVSNSSGFTCPASIRSPAWQPNRSIPHRPLLSRRLTPARSPRP